MRRANQSNATIASSAAAAAAAILPRRNRRTHSFNASADEDDRNPPSPPRSFLTQNYSTSHSEEDPADADVDVDDVSGLGNRRVVRTRNNYSSADPQDDVPSLPLYSTVPTPGERNSNQRKRDPIGKDSSSVMSSTAIRSGGNGGPDAAIRGRGSSSSTPAAGTMESISLGPTIAGGTGPIRTKEKDPYAVARDPYGTYTGYEGDDSLVEGEERDWDAVEEMRKGKGKGKGVDFGGRSGREIGAKPKNWREALVYRQEWVWTVVYTLLSMWTRYYKIGLANYVVWDEAHFGKFGSHYINRDFYFDVHPPLGKMLVGLAGLLSGYRGNFEFKSGVEYPADVPYTAMRVILASFGMAMVPIAWWTSGEMGWSRWTRHWVTLCVLCDVGWLCISRFILLDSMLLFFTFTTVLGLVKFRSQRREPFGEDWWAWLIFTGLSIGCVCSVKWVGLFATCLVGEYVLEDLWEKFGDLRMPFKTYIYHWLARGLCLIVLPFCVYAMSFRLHFLILNRSGPGDAQMSSLFQAHLKGNDFAESPLEVAYGSKLTIKNYGYGGGLLHSHVQTFPVGSNQQQVTCYHYKDDNNNFVVTPPWNEPDVKDDEPIRYIADGSHMRLVHAATGRNLHSHAVAAPVTKINYEVSGYGNLTIGDDNDIWIVEVVDDMHQGKKEKVERVHSLTTRLRFRHKMLNCYLKAENVPLPQWGFKQVEVTCDKQNNPKDVHTYWNIESHWNDRLPKGNAKLYRSPFWKDFWHLNVAMMTSNNALIPDPDKDDILASKPLDWPWLKLGLRMCGWGDHQVKYYLIGNPVVWWLSTAALGVGLASLVVFGMRMQRQYQDWKGGQWDDYLFGLKVSFGGWALHFVPFLIMGRVTYLHHYLPTLWFAVLMTGHMLDLLIFSSSRVPKLVKPISFVVLAGAVVFAFWWFRKVAFGITGPIGDEWGLTWRKSWNIYQ